MVIITRLIMYMAMTLLGIVSMWTTYVSLHDSILPEPVIRLHLGTNVVWDCSIFALGLSVAIGMMLFALKVAIIDEQKRLNVLGLLGLTVVGFISISFNLDVLYRTADRDFFVRYSSEKMRAVYEDYLRNVQTELLAKEQKLKKEVAKQEGVEVRLYSIIYELIDEVRDAMTGLLEPKLRQVVTGQAEVRQGLADGEGAALLRIIAEE